MKKLSSIVRSSASLVLARVLSAFCAFLLFWVISQKSVQALGAFRTIFVFFLFTEFIPLLGTNQFVIREVSVSREHAKQYFLHSLSFALLVSLMVSALLILLAVCGKYSETISRGLIIVAAGMPATAGILCGQSVLIGLGRGDLFGIIQGTEAFIRTVAGILLLYYGHDILSVVVCFIVTRWFILSVYWLLLLPYIKKGKWGFDRMFFVRLVREVPSFAGILVCYLIIRFAPQVMLPWMKDEIAAGRFAVAFQFLDLALLVPTAFAINLMPVFAQKFEVSMDVFSDLCHQAIKIISFLIIPAVSVTFLMSKPLILAVFGKEYIASVLILKILIWVAFLFAVDQILSMATIAGRKQHYDLFALGCGSISTVVFLYFLILKMGVTGAAIGYLLGTIVLITVRIFSVKLFIHKINPLIQLWKPVLAVLPVFVVVNLLKYHWIILAIIGLAVYCICLVCIGGLSVDERLAMRRLLGSDVQR